MTGDGMELRRRSLVKGVVWNLIGLAMMTLVGVAATGSMAVGGTLAMVNTGIGLVMYFLYERVWSGIRWGTHV
jgi:uncharacterized membrane protein